MARIELFIFRRIDDVHAAGHHRDGADRPAPLHARRNRCRAPGPTPPPVRQRPDRAPGCRRICAPGREALRAPTMATISFCSRCGMAQHARSAAAADPAPPGPAESPARRPRSGGRPVSPDLPVRARRRLPAAGRNSCRRRAAPGAAILPARRDAEPKRAIRLREGDGADILGARQPQPGAALAVV